MEKIVKSIEESGLIIKTLAKQSKMNQKTKGQIARLFIRYIRC